MNRIVAASVVAALAIPAAGALDPSGRSIAEAQRAVRKESYTAARASLDDAIDYAVQTGDAARETQARTLLGALLDATGDGSGAAKELDRARDRARASGDARAEAAVLRELGFAHWRRAEYDAARRLADEALAVQTALDDRTGAGASTDLLGRIDLKTGRFDEAATRLERAYRLRGAAGDLGGEADSRVALVLAHLERRDYRRASAEAEALWRVGRDAADRDVEFEGLAQIAIVWMFQNAPEAALASLERARELAGDPPDPALQARAGHLEANALRSCGDHAAAIEAHDAAIRGYEAVGNRREVAWNLARKARSLAVLGRTADAEASLRRALSLWMALDDRRAAAYWIYEYGKLLLAMGRTEEARAAWEEALRREIEIDLPYRALVLVELASLDARRGAVEASRVRASAAVAAAESSGTPELLWTALYRRALIERSSGRKDAALSDLRRALAVVEEMRRRVVPVDEALIGFLEDKQEVFAEAVDLLMEMGRPREALAVAESARARAFLDLLPRGSRAPSPSSTSPAAGSAGSTIVEYFVGRARTYAWVIERSGRLHAVTIPVGAPAYASRIGTLRERVGAERVRAGGDDGAADLEGARAVLRELDDELWEPIAPWLPRDPESRVTIVPHGPLFALPFSGLIDRDGRYAVESHTLDYAPSIAVLTSLAASGGRAVPGSDGCLVVANPLATPLASSAAGFPDLPDAEAEAKEVAAAVVGGARDVLLGSSATEAAVRSLAPTRAVLHFATHGIIRDDDPLASALVLAPSPGGGPSSDGLLQAREVVDMRLSAGLVTLAACESGLGRVTGEGILGLSRAFLHAGAESVVVSLWRVSDLVSHYQMDRFYAGLRDGRPRAAALRRAQLDTLAALRRGDLETDSGRKLAESPLLWAPFVLVGDGRGRLDVPRTAVLRVSPR